MIPILFRVILPVDNIEKATALYQTIFDQPGRRVSPGRHYFDSGLLIVACVDPKADGDEYEAQPLPDHIYFAVDDLEEMLERWHKGPGCVVTDSIAERPWGERSFYGSDPFGNKLCFVDHKTVFTGKE